MAWTISDSPKARASDAKNDSPPDRVRDIPPQAGVRVQHIKVQPALGPQVPDGRLAAEPVHTAGQRCQPQIRRRDDLLKIILLDIGLQAQLCPLALLPADGPVHILRHGAALHGCIVCGGVFRDLLGGGFIALQGSVGLAQLRLQLGLPGLGGLQRLPQGRLVGGGEPLRRPGQLCRRALGLGKPLLPGRDLPTQPVKLRRREKCRLGGCVIGKARGKTGRMQRRLLTNQGICSICLGIVSCCRVASRAAWRAWACWTAWAAASASAWMARAACSS